jgi:hypothetical protein
MSHTVILNSAFQRRAAARMVERAPDGYVVAIRAPTRSTAQNDKMWAMLTDVSRALPAGREATPDVWKCLFMQALAHEVQFEIGLDGKPFPVGHSTSKLSKAQMADLITFIQQYGDANGVQWSDEATAERIVA